MKGLEILRKIKKTFSNYEPLVEVLIYKDNLIHNLNEYKRSYPKFSFAPVLKSNAYGHGLVLVAQILDKEDVAFFCVDSLFEAKTLRHQGIKSPILIIGYTSFKNIKKNKVHDVTFSISSLDQLREIVKNLKESRRFHLKIDTGMHRQGVLPEEINEAIEIIKSNNFLKLEGVFSHLADADGEDQNFTKTQIEQWNKICEIFKQNIKNVKFFHLSNTAGTNYTDQIYGNTARLGIGLYGVNPSPFAKLDLKPALQMQSIISSTRTIQAGESVGYNCTFRANQVTRIASVPVGYFEGVDRRLSNRGFLKINNIFCPIIGRVSMNITTVDVTLLPEVKINSEVVIISNNSQDKNSAENIAKMINSIPYEVLIHIPQHLKRIVK